MTTVAFEATHKQGIGGKYSKGWLILREETASGSLQPQMNHSGVLSKSASEERRGADFKAFQALQGGSLKTMNGNQSKNLPQQPTAYSKGTVPIVQIFISSAQKVAEPFLLLIVCFLAFG